MEIHWFLVCVGDSKARLRIRVIRHGLWRLPAHKTNARHLNHWSFDIQDYIIVLTSGWRWNHATIVCDCIPVVIFLSAQGGL